MKATKNQIVLIFLENPEPVSVSQIVYNWQKLFGLQEERHFLYPALSELVSASVLGEFDIEYSGAFDLASAEHERFGEVDFDELEGISNLSELICLSRGAVGYVNENSETLATEAEALGLKEARAAIRLSSLNNNRELRVDPTFGPLENDTGWLTAPASDRVVDLTHNQKGVEDAISKIDAATRVIRESNTLPAEERDLFLHTIESGKALLSNSKVYAFAALAAVTKPLYDAYSSVIEEAAKPIIQAALEAVKALFQ